MWIIGGSGDFLFVLLTVLGVFSEDVTFLRKGSRSICVSRRASVLNMFGTKEESKWEKINLVSSDNRNLNVDFSLKLHEGFKLEIRFQKMSESYEIVFFIIPGKSKNLKTCVKTDDSQISCNSEKTVQIDKYITDETITLRLFSKNLKIIVSNEFQEKSIIDLKGNLSTIKINTNSFEKRFSFRIDDYLTYRIKKVEENQFIGSFVSDVEKDFSFYVAQCRKCKIILKFEDEAGTNSAVFPVAYRSGKYSFSVKKNVSTSRKNPNTLLYLHATAFNDGDHRSEGYWIIDSLRYEKSVGRPKIFTYDAESDSYNFSCEEENSSSVISAEDDNFGIDSICSDPKYVGKNCDVSCEFLTRTKYCDNYVICKNNKCTCSAGHEGFNCKDACSHNTYGYNCKGRCSINCGPVRRDRPRRCDRFSGTCTAGCEKGFKPPLCHELHLPRLKHGPSIIDVGINSVKIRLNNEYEGAKPSAFRIQYKKDTEKPWIFDDRIYGFGIKEVTVRNLRKSHRYDIRVILQIVNYETDNFLDANVPVAHFTTSCKDVDVKKLQFVIEPKNVKVQYPDHEKDDELCAPTSCVVKMNENEYHFNNSNAVVITDLKPATSYHLLYTANNNLTGKKLIRTKEAAPSPVTNLTSTIGSSYIYLKWSKPEEENGMLQRNLIEFQLQGYVNCSSEKGVPVQKQTNYLYINLTDLEPFAIYEVGVAARTSIIGERTNRTITTLPLRIITRDELIQKGQISTEVNTTSLKVNWDHLECDKRKGPLIYIFSLKCIDDDEQNWCNDPRPVRTDAYSSPAFFTGLIPFTKYRLFASALRESSGARTEETFLEENKTNPDVPPIVCDISVFSKDETYLALRWKPPFPPYGEIAHYRVRLNGTKDIRISKNDTKNCLLWQDYICYNRTDLAKDTDYSINVFVKNRDVEENSIFFNPSQCGVSARTRQEVPSRPTDLVPSWANNKLMLNWKHPDKENGPIGKFLIVLTLNSTKLLAMPNKTNFVEHYEISRTRKYYTYTVKSPFLFSSMYKISVCAVNKYLGENTTDIFNTPKPETPKFLSEEFSVTVAPKEVLKVHLPDVNLSTVTNETYIYVIVSEVNSENATGNVRGSDLYRSVVGKVRSGGEKWIAFESQLTRPVKTIILGDDKVSRSISLSTNILNKKLNLESPYDVHVVLRSVYFNETTYKYYKLPRYVPSKTNPAFLSVLLLLLLLLLVVPAIGCYLYRRKKYPNGVTTSARRRHRRRRQEIDNDLPLVDRESVEAGPGGTRRGEKRILPDLPTDEDRRPDASPVNVGRFEEYVRESVKNGDLSSQHKQFPRGQTKPWDYGTQPANKFKNRYANLAAYDSNRVVLKTQHGDAFSDYINASYVDGYDRPRAYIATQGPKSSTINDFWRMIWEENSHTIVMLANLTEGGKRKCEKYWPELEETREFGNVSVTYLKNDIYADYEYRTFQISCDGSYRIVEQFHFTSWPDHGVPVYPQLLMPFVKKIVSVPYRNEPIVVHCSAGVGRTGTIILCDICLRMASNENKVDVLKHLKRLREQRVNMVDNYEQYKLVHLVVMEHLLTPETNVPCQNFTQTLERIKADGTIQRNLNYLKRTGWQNGLDLQDNATADLTGCGRGNDSKNRFRDIVPRAAARVSISFDGNVANSDYINAVPVDGFRLKNQFIATQLPLPGTLQDFWTMIQERNVNTIIVLNDLPSIDETCCQFYPSVGEELETTRGVTVRHRLTEMFQHYDIISFDVTSKNDENRRGAVRLVQVKGWHFNKKLPALGPEVLFSIYDNADILTRVKHPVVVSCYDGATACGLYIALSFIIERIKLEQQVDVCLAVRIIQKNRSEFVNNEKQFLFLYQAADEFLKKFEDYCNFK